MVYLTSFHLDNNTFRTLEAEACGGHSSVSKWYFIRVFVCNGHSEGSSKRYYWNYCNVNLMPLILVVLWVFMMFCLDVEQKIMIEFAQHGRLLLVLGAATWNYATLTLIICEMGKQKYPTAKVIR